MTTSTRTKLYFNYNIMEAIQQFKNQMITNNTIHKINVRFKDFSSRKAIISNNGTIDLTLLKLDISDYLE